MAEAFTIIGELQIAKLSLKAGDVLVVRVDRTIDSDTAQRLRASLEPLLPDGVKAMVIDPRLELSVAEAGRGFA